ncbi:ester cyclase [Paenibacillus sp. SYP-B3998]|uniref:Ester cyclase n=1 Tax=Paenibacillus sp. SYP-B3998 TaxID=2678564 RepID=A0A6G3ZY79_9BACL|nr:ester cyclase [Paenibacillus sp. SYP-B3998]NEW06539.1 ester cyclase [Paenibacillus sp. SYP-B3998]
MKPLFIVHLRIRLITFEKKSIEAYGSFHLEVQELNGQENRVYVRWKQTSIHKGEVDGFAPTGKTEVEITSAVYQEESKIEEY